MSVTQIADSVLAGHISPSVPSSMGLGFLSTSLFPYLTVSLFLISTIVPFLAYSRTICSLPLYAASLLCDSATFSKRPVISDYALPFTVCITPTFIFVPPSYSVTNQPKSATYHGTTLNHLEACACLSCLICRSIRLCSDRRNLGCTSTGHPREPTSIHMCKRNLLPLRRHKITLGFLLRIRLNLHIPRLLFDCTVLPQRWRLQHNTTCQLPTELSRCLGTARCSNQDDEIERQASHLREQFMLSIRLLLCQRFTMCD